MSKHKTVKMWVAQIDTGWIKDPARVACTQVEVVETPKQYRIEGPSDDPDVSLAIRGCGYKRHVNKASNTSLYGTRGEALRALDAYLIVQEQRAKRCHDVAAENLFLITEALENESC